MITPVSAATPDSAMKPTATATDMLKPSHHINQMPPTGRERPLPRHRLLRLGDVAAEIPPCDVDEDVNSELTVLRPDRGRASRQLDPRDVAERNRAAARQCDLNVPRDSVGVGTEFPRIADDDGIPLPTFDGRRHRLGA